MMELNLKSFLKFLTIAFLVEGCGMTDKPDLASFPHKCQAVVIIDKTNSVSFTSRLPKLQQEITNKLGDTYAAATKGVQSAHLIITGNTRVFPDYNYFRSACPEGDEESRSFQQSLLNWKTEKRKWISEEVKQVVALIESPCNSNKTDIFPIFSGIQQAQKNNAPWDSVNILIFSDMINTCAPVNMLNEITVSNAQEKGKRVCQSLIDDGQISKENTDKLHLTIYTPENMNKTALVSQFWKGFFGNWGLKETQYHFE
jgi:hypothetical protein